MFISNSKPKGKAKYVFDIGAEQIGEYLTTAQPPEEGAEEDTPPVITTRWIVNKTQQLSNLYDPTGDDLKSPEMDKAECKCQSIENLVFIQFIYLFKFNQLVKVEISG